MIFNESYLRFLSIYFALIMQLPKEICNICYNFIHHGNSSDVIVSIVPIDPFLPSVAFHIGISHFSALRTTGLYLNRNTGVKWVKR